MQLSRGCSGAQFAALRARTDALPITRHEHIPRAQIFSDAAKQQSFGAYRGATGGLGTINAKPHREIRKMKVAIPEHQGRVAPVFDTCRRVLIFSQDAEGEVPLGLVDWSATCRHERPARLKELGVEMLLCGGISGWMECQLSVQGIRTMPWLAGGVQEILEAFRLGRVTEPQYAMPGRAGFREGRAEYVGKFAGWCCRKQPSQGKGEITEKSRKRRRNLPPG